MYELNCSGLLQPCSNLFVKQRALYSLSDPATLPWYEQVMRAASVIHTNYSLLWQHLSASTVLPELSFLSESQKEEVESYQQRAGRNAVIINTLLRASVKHTPEGLLTLCETLQTTPGSEYIAEQILRGTSLFKNKHHMNLLFMGAYFLWVLIILILWYGTTSQFV